VEADAGVAGKDHDQPGHRHEHDQRPAQQSDCTVFSLAQNAHASIVQAFDLKVHERTIARDREPTFVTAVSFNPAPFSQRAPPLL
jgi:hypothetical protein